MQKIFNFLYFLFITAVIVLVLLMVSTKIHIPGNFGVKVVLSGSMEPAISVGSLIVIKPAQAYKIGDIITFGEESKDAIPTTHRVVEMRVDNGVMVYVTKGDANNDRDIKEVREDEVIGKMLFDIPYLGYIIALAKKPIGLIFLVIVPAAIVIGDEIRKIIAQMRRIHARKMSEHKPPFM